MTTTRAIFISVAILFVVLGLFEMTSLDVAVQDRLYNFDTHEWAVDEDAWGPWWVFYLGPKIGLGVYAAALLAIAIVAWRKNRKPTFVGGACVYLLLCLMVIPLTVGRLKAISRVHCPEQLVRYGGRQPYRKVFAAFPPGCCDEKKPGDCFPAGHASAGFALLSLAFVTRTRARGWLGLSVGLAAGWVMGLYQMLKGSHFLSHTIVTMLLAFIICQAMARILRIRPNASLHC